MLFLRIAVIFPRTQNTSEHDRRCSVSDARHARRHARTDQETVLSCGLCREMRETASRREAWSNNQKGLPPLRIGAPLSTSFIIFTT